MQLTRLRRSAAIIPVALTLALFLAAGPAMAQPASGKTDSHSSTPDDPALGTPAPPAEGGASAPSPGVVSSETLWFYILDGQKMGPVSTEGMRQLLLNGKVGTATKVWRNGMAGWLPLKTLPEFADMAPPPTPGEQKERKHVRVDNKSDSGPQPARTKRKGLIVLGSLVFGITWIAGITSAIFASENEDQGTYNPSTGNYDEDDKYTKYSQVGWIPIVGPISGYATAGGDDNRVITLMVLWSAAQATGLGLLIAGIVGKKNPHYKGEEKEAGIQVAPLVGQLNGIGLMGRF